MGTRSPPDGFILTGGTWGTDADREETLFLSGSNGIRYKNTAIATRLLSPFYQLDASIMGAVGDTGLYTAVYSAFATVRADSVAAGNTVTIKANAYDQTRAAILETSTLWNAVLTAANTWQVVEHPGIGTSRTDLRWVQFEISKAANAFNVYVDKLELRKSNPTLMAGRSSTQTIANNTITDVVFLSGPSNGYSNGVYLDTATGIAKLFYPGFYFVAAHVYLTNLANGADFYTQLVDADSANVLLNGSRFSNGAASDACSVISGLVWGGTYSSGHFASKRIKVQVYQQSGGNRDIAANLSRFHIARMGDL